MAAYSFNNNFSSSGDCYSGFFDPFSRDLGQCNGIISSHGGSLNVSQKQSLVLDSEKGELVKAPVKVGKKSVSDEKSIAALKNHSEAERRRRERINAHLDTLRSLLPFRGKMDKATLLGEVIRQVKELKKNAAEASKDYLVPMDDDEVRVETRDDDEANGAFSFEASICCDYRPGLLTDIRHAIESLPIKMVNAEISTLGGRLKNYFVFTCCRSNTPHVDDAETRRFLARSIHQALNSVLEKASTPPEYSPCSTFPSKRQRISYFDSSSSSS
ncbi:hypothetical protein PTKIN_Ptkin18bG0112700 [Pterospermum kingtungense]